MTNISREVQDGSVLALGNDGSIDFFDVAGWRTTCSRSAYRNGYFNGLILFDLFGQKFRVETAFPVHEKRTLSSYFRRSITVSLSVSLEGKPPFEQIQSDVIAHVEAHRDFWEAAGDYRLLLDTLRGTENVRDIARGLNLIASQK
jgi:hypothetical protein